AARPSRLSDRKGIRSMKPTLLLLLTLVLSWRAAAPPARADDRRVPAQYATIQAAIDAANDRDQIILADRVYTGPGNFGLAVPSKSLPLRSESGDPATCILDGQRASRILTIQSGWNFQGVTFRNGYAIGDHSGGFVSGQGGALLTTAGATTLRD